MQLTKLTSYYMLLLCLKAEGVLEQCKSLDGGKMRALLEVSRSELFVHI